MKMGSPRGDSGDAIFGEGSSVEVSSNVDGFRGAWFEARVLETPPSSLRRSTRTMNFLVEYKTLLSNDDGTKPLREPVTFGLIRPLPPAREVHDDDRSFEVNDVVEAYYNDGWWVGVVGQVWEDPKAYTVVFYDPLHFIKFRPSELRVHLDWVDGKWVQPPKKKKVGNSSRKRKREEDSKSLLRDKPVELTGSSSKAKDMEMAIVPINKVDDGEPISMLSRTIGVDSSDQSSEGEGRLYNIVVQCDAREAKNQSSPLLKSSSSILSFIQSMEVFRLMPQNPHFLPLNECNEICREGLAVGQLVTFAKVVEKTSELQVDTSRTTFNSIVECLSELESHGFDVKAVRGRLLELQTMKESRELLLAESEKYRGEIRERAGRETKIKAEVDGVTQEDKVLKEKMKAMEEKKRGLISMIEENNSKIAEMKSSDDLVNEEIQKLEQKFQSLAASPWRLNM